MFKFDALTFLQTVAIPAFEITTIIISIAAYSYIYKVLRRSRKLTRTMRTRTGTFVPFWIVVTYIIFICGPQAIVVVLFYHMKIPKVGHPMYPIGAVLFVVGFLSDVIIYIFLNERLRRNLVKLFKTGQKRVDEDVSYVIHSLS